MKPLTAEEIAELRGGMRVGDIAENAGSYVRDALPRLLDEVERARALLKQIEWAGYVDGYESGCPACSAVRIADETEHCPGCELTALLATQ